MNTKGEKINIKELVKSSRELVIEQLNHYLRCDQMRFFSWGSHAFRVDNMRTPKLYRFMVQGRNHHGHVYIILNGMDLFDVYLTSSRGTIKEIGTDLYADMLAEWIDARVEG